MKHKIDRYKVYSKGRTWTVLTAPCEKGKWKFVQPNADHLIVHSNPAGMKQIQQYLAALANDPAIMIYLPARKAGNAYDVVLLRPELRFRFGDWCDIKAKLDQKHWVGRYTIRHNEKQLNDLWERNFRRKLWLAEHQNIVEEVVDDTLFLVLPKPVCLEYHRDISHAMKTFDPTDGYVAHAGIGYILPERWPAECAMET